MMDQTQPKLAIHGGKPALAERSGFIFPGSDLIDAEEEAAVLEVLRSRRLYRYHNTDTEQAKADQLETNFAKHMGVNHALAVTSGTSALMCGLQGIGVGPGDEVIVPAYTWMATATAVMLLGGIPIVAEVDESLGLDPADVEAKISPHTKAIIAVHMSGVPARIDEIQAVTQRHKLKLVEDTAQAVGASYKGRRLGSIGDVGCFSLQLSKIITSGEGGMMITSQESVWNRALMFHDVPGGLRNDVPLDETIWGVNFRMAELAAAVALVQLTKLDGLLAMLRSRKQMLKGGLNEVMQRKGLQFRQVSDPDGDAGTTLTWFVDNAEVAHTVAEALNAENIGASVLYHPDRQDYHVYAHWTGLLNKRSWTEANAPWAWANRPVDYSRDMCPQSLDLLGRAVRVNVNPFMDNSGVEEMIEGIERVLTVLA